MKVKSLFALALFLFLIHCIQAKVTLPRLITDGMILQRDTKVKIWGWASNEEKIDVTFNNKKLTTTADANGKWFLFLPSTRAGGPYKLEINNTISIKDIFFGDVWLCSGQSNMALTMERVKERYPEVIEHSENHLIRQFFIPTTYDFNNSKEDINNGTWMSANPKNILGFSAVAYFFAKDLFEKYKIPIGLINSSVGGSPAEAWISEDALLPFPEYLSTVQQLKRPNYIDSIRRQEGERISEWYGNIKLNDLGEQKNQKAWYDSTYDYSEWPTLKIPGMFEEAGINPGNGVVWVKKEFEIPQDLAGKSAKLFLGRIIDSDSVYINGVFVGTTGYQYPPRRYEVAPNILKKGKNTITARVIINSVKGGFIIDKPYYLDVSDQKIDLQGIWKYKLGTTAGTFPPMTFFQYKPTGLFNGMIAPVLNYSIKGVIWYQGEAHANKPENYKALFESMIANWRSKWNQEDLPFIFVQLANYLKAANEPSESKWAELREQQLKTLEIPNTAMVVIHDVGEWNDIHPLNKSDVGKRLALAAKQMVYREKIVGSGPIYQSMKIDGNKVILSFSNVGSGLIAHKNQDLKHFSICGPDKKFIWAKAKIEGNRVIVWNELINNPIAVRYAWADNPESANLYNRELLPASSFRTDTP